MSFHGINGWWRQTTRSETEWEGQREREVKYQEAYWELCFNIQVMYTSVKREGEEHGYYCFSRQEREISSVFMHQWHGSGNNAQSGKLTGYFPVVCFIRKLLDVAYNIPLSNPAVSCVRKFCFTFSSRWCENDTFPDRSHSLWARPGRATPGCSRWRAGPPRTGSHCQSSRPCWSWQRGGLLLGRAGEPASGSGGSRRRRRPEEDAWPPAHKHKWISPEVFTDSSLKHWII